MEELAEKMGIPKFSEMEQVNPEDFRRLAKTAANAEETQDNPVVFSEDDFVSIFEKLYRKS